MKRYIPYIPLIILLAGAALRIAGTGASAIWYDEAVTWSKTQVPLWQWITSYQADLSGCVLLDVLLRPLMLLGSHSLWLLRLPSLAASLVSLWLAWLLMRRLDFGLTQQIITSALVACLPGLLWIAQDARPYSLMACLALAALWFALEGGWLGLLACGGMLMYCHTTGAIYAVMSLLVALAVHPWHVRRILWVGAGILLAWVPAIIRALTTFAGIGPRQPWQVTLSLDWLLGSTLQAFWTHAVNTSAFALTALAVLLLTLPLLISKNKAHGRQVALLAWCVPLVGLLIASLLWMNVILYRSLMPILPLFCLWLGWELGRMDLTGWKNVYRPILLTAWALLLTFGLLTWQPAARGAGLDRVAASLRTAFRPGDVLFYGTSTVSLPFDFYLSDLPHYQWPSLTSQFLNEPGLEPPNTALPEAATRTWLIYPADPLLTPAEQLMFDQLTQGQALLYTITYLHAAPIKIFLIDR
jgi:hypothetical protein